MIDARVLSGGGRRASAPSSSGWAAIRCGDAGQRGAGLTTTMKTLYALSPSTARRSRVSVVILPDGCAAEHEPDSAYGDFTGERVAVCISAKTQTVASPSAISRRSTPWAAHTNAGFDRMLYVAIPRSRSPRVSLHHHRLSRFRLQQRLSTLAVTRRRNSVGVSRSTRAFSSKVWPWSARWRYEESFAGERSRLANAREDSPVHQRHSPAPLNEQKEETTDEASPGRAVAAALGRAVRRDQSPR